MKEKQLFRKVADSVGGLLIGVIALGTICGCAPRREPACFAPPKPEVSNEVVRILDGPSDSHERQALKSFPPEERTEEALRTIREFLKIFPPEVMKNFYYKKMASNVLAKALVSTDSVALQRWAVQILNFRIPTGSAIVFGCDDVVPPFVLSLFPWPANLAEECPRHMNCVLVAFGGPYGTAGMFIGRTNFIPATNDLYVIPWKPGIYAFSAYH